MMGLFLIYSISERKSSSQFFKMRGSGKVNIGIEITQCMTSVERVFCLQCDLSTFVPCRRFMEKTLLFFLSYCEFILLLLTRMLVI